MSEPKISEGQARKMALMLRSAALWAKAEDPLYFVEEWGITPREAILSVAKTLRDYANRKAR